MSPKKTLAVWKFSSCDGCQLSLLDCEDELLTIAGQLEIAYFLEVSRAKVQGPYDVSLVEGSITTPHEAELIQEVRANSKALITIGACATAGGIQALRNFADVEEFTRIVYASPDYISTLATSTPISANVPVDFELNGCPISKQQLLEVIGACATAGGIQALRNFADVEEFTRIVYASPDYISTLATSTPISANVPVDFELNGCPISKQQLLEVISAYLNRRRPRVRAHSVCVECKRRGTVCVMVAHGTPCLGPVTHAGCGAICPAYNRGCYGCFGPMETPNTASLNVWTGLEDRDLVRIYRTFHASADGFRETSEAHERQ